MTTTYPPETHNGTVTSWAPLTTVFTPPAGCETKFYSEDFTIAVYDPGYGIDFDNSARCAADAVTASVEQTRLGGGRARTSIGPVTCPYQWSTLSSSTSGSSTQIMCCPPGYFLSRFAPWTGQTNVIFPLDCESNVYPGDVVTWVNPVDFETTTKTLNSTSAVHAIGVIGWNIALETTTTVSSPTSPATSLPTPTSPNPTMTSSASIGGSSSPALSTGAAVGIGVGVGLAAAIGLAGLLVALYLRSKRRRNMADAGNAAPSEPPDYKPRGPQELDSAAMYQIDSEGRWGAELAAPYPPQELP